MYCLDCRALHRERSKGDHEDLPLCDKTKGKKCEIVQGWVDEDGERQTKPFQLDKNNHLAMELYGRIISLSDMQEVEWSKGKKMMHGYLPTLSRLEFVFDNFLPDTHKSVDDIDLMIEKIQIIHSIKTRNMLKG